jgi:hypothetical protein
MQCPEIGRLVAEEVVAGEITSMDVTPLRIERFWVAAGDTQIGMVV